MQALNDVSSDPRWAALVARDAGARGFFYAVLTTGIFCRPGCAARLPRPENVRFFAGAAAAVAAGYRPCRRCRPEQPETSVVAGKVAAACRMIERAETPPPLAALAKAAGLSPFHFHRVFKAATGVTPKAYAAQRREERVRQGLAASRTVTGAVYEAGFNGSGQFYATAKETLGMTPASWRAAGAGETIRYATGEFALGTVLVAASEAGICAIALGETAAALVADLAARFHAATLLAGDTALAGQLAAVIALVEAPGRGLDLPLDIRGTAFQRLVWQALREIPAGATASYAEVARRVGAPGAARAVAGACAANKLAVAVPCHRVVRGDGALSGYRWGVARKRRLLEREAADAG